MSDKTLTLYPLAVELYKKIRGRTTAYYQYPDELGNKIGPAKEPKWITTKSGKKKNIGSDYPLEIETYIQHLNGEKTIGIYPHNEKDNCFFLVFCLMDMTKYLILDSCIVVVPLVKGLIFLCSKMGLIMTRINGLNS